MKCIANSLREASWLAVVGMLLNTCCAAQGFAQDATSLLKTFPVERCDDTKRRSSDKWNYLLFEDSELFRACVDAGKSIVINRRSDALSGIRPLTQNPIIVRPKMAEDTLYIDGIGISSGSKLILDRLCRRNTELFDTIFQSRGCPVDGVYSFSESDALAAVFNFGVGTTFSIGAVLNPLVLGPGYSGAIRQYNTRGFGKSVIYLNSLEIGGMSTKQIILEGLITENDFTIKETLGGYVSLSQLIILGSLKISLNELESLSLNHIWVAGDLIIESTSLEALRLEGVRVLGNLNIADINYLQSSKDWRQPISFDTIDIEGRVSVEKPNSFASRKMKQQFDEFFDRLGRQLSHMNDLRRDRNKR